MVLGLGRSRRGRIVKNHARSWHPFRTLLCPRDHQDLPFLQEVCAEIGCTDLLEDCVGEGCLAHLLTDLRHLGATNLEGAPHSVRRSLLAKSHVPQHFRERHIPKRGTGLHARENEIRRSVQCAPLLGPPRNALKAAPRGRALPSCARLGSSKAALARKSHSNAQAGSHRCVPLSSAVLDMLQIGVSAPRSRRTVICSSQIGAVGTSFMTTLCTGCRNPSLQYWFR